MVVGIEGNLTAHLQYMALGQRQAKSKTFRQVIDLGERFENRVAVRLRNTHSCIFEDKADGAVCQFYM